MVPLLMMSEGDSAVIRRITGNDETKKFIEKLGFTVGTRIAIVSKIGGNLIVRIKDSRVAVAREMARRIMV